MLSFQFNNTQKWLVQLGQVADQSFERSYLIEEPKIFIGEGDYTDLIGDTSMNYFKATSIAGSDVYEMSDLSFGDM